jgi:Leucine-rich repeat (LRR) protein
LLNKNQLNFYGKMKMRNILLFAVLLLSQATATSLKADVVLDATNFPDAKFRAYVAKLTNVAEGGTITTATANGITLINCRAMGIADITGLKYFPNVTSLCCSVNSLTSLDLSGNTAITNLDCNTNNITSLDVSGNTGLTSLSCGVNKLTALDVSVNTGLTFLACGSNSLKTLDVSHNTLLTELLCYSNQLTALDVSANTELTLLTCYSNNLTALDVTHNTKLVKLFCNSNLFPSLDVTHNTALTELNCGGNNNLTTLDVTKNTKLTTLYCGDSKLTTIDLSKNTALVTLNLTNDQLSTLDVSLNTELTQLYVHINKLSSLDVTHNTKLSTLWCNQNKLTSLDVSRNTLLESLRCNYNQLTMLDVTRNTSLSTLSMYSNSIAAINLSNNVHLSTFEGTMNGRKINVYSYVRGAGYVGAQKAGYYVPLTDQTGEHPSSNLGALIDNAGQAGDELFDLSKLDTTSLKGATMGAINGTKVLFLDATTRRFSYNYNTSFTGSASTWTTDNHAVVPYNNFYITCDLEDVLSAVDGVESNGVNVYTTAGTINIVGSYNGKVNVYNLSGRQVYCGNSGEITVPAGMYVVKVDGAVHKVLVK